MPSSPSSPCLPAPAATLRLEAVSLGPATGEQLTLSSPEQEQAPADLARRCARPARPAGSEAVLRVLEVDPESRVPERREVLMPFRGA